MKLSMLEKTALMNKVLIFQTSSTKINIFVTDKLKKLFGSNQDTMRDLADKKDMKVIKEIYNVDPYLSDRWLVTVQLGKFGGKYKELIDLIINSTTVFFICIAESYRVFKGFKEALNKFRVQQVCDLYLTYLKSSDFHYLYRELVPETNRMPNAIADYVCQSYGADIDAVLDLFNVLQEGTPVTTRRDVSDICGIGGNSVDSFIFSLIKNPPTSAKGAMTVIKNRLQAGDDLAQVYGYTSFYNQLSACVKQLVDIKMLVLSGVVYKRITEVPNGYDEKKLPRYQKYIWRLRDIPLSRLLRLKIFLGTTAWKSGVDLMQSIYGYYKDIIQYEVIPFLPRVDGKEVEDDYVKAEKRLKERQKLIEEEQDAVGQRRATELIRKYGAVEGRRRYKEEKANGTIPVSVGNNTQAGLLRERPENFGRSTTKQDTKEVLDDIDINAFNGMLLCNELFK